MGARPVVFVGSSREGLPIAEAIQLNLDKDCDVLVWDQGSFEISKTYIESLVELARVDFAVLVLTADDVATNRGKKHNAPRDNVLFELGLFIGILGRDRTFFVRDAEKDLKIPSDLFGITSAEYREQSSGNLQSSLGPACTRIRGAIRKRGPRVKLDPVAVAAHQEIFEFSQRAIGKWWSFRHWDSKTIGALELSYDAAAGGLVMDGQGYSLSGELVAKWDSKASCIHRDERKMYYYWEGWKPASRAGTHKKFEGFGELTFAGGAGPFKSAVGVFSERPLADATKSNMKSSKYRRITAKEAKVLADDDPDKVAVLVRKKLGR